MKAGAGCNVYRESPVMSASPMPPFPSMADRQGETDEDAMRSEAGLLKWFPETGWMSVYLCRDGYYAYIDMLGKYTARPAKSLDELPMEALRGPLTLQSCPNTSVARRKRGKI